MIPSIASGLNNRYKTPTQLVDSMAAGLPIVASELPEIVRFVRGCDVGVTAQRVEERTLARVLKAGPTT